LICSRYFLARDGTFTICWITFLKTAGTSPVRKFYGACTIRECGTKQANFDDFCDSSGAKTYTHPSPQTEKRVERESSD
jgi:hypothetical protein